MIHSKLLHLPFFIQCFSLTLGAFYIVGSGLNATAIRTGSSFPGKPRASGERGERDGEKKREGGRGGGMVLAISTFKGRVPENFDKNVEVSPKNRCFIKEERLELVIFGIPVGKSVVIRYVMTGKKHVRAP